MRNLIGGNVIADIRPDQIEEITDSYEEEGSVNTATLSIANLYSVLNKKLSKVFMFRTHASAVWYNYCANKTVKQKIDELEATIKTLQDKLNVIGTYYGGGFDSVDLVYGKYTTIASITVPPGRYLVIGSAQVNQSLSGINVLAIDNMDIRFNCSGGGGACVAAIFYNSIQYDYKLQMYSGNDVSYKTYATLLQAIRIK